MYSYVQARAKITNTAKLFLDSTYVHEYSEMRMLLETEFSRQYVCSADVHEQLRDRKERKQESFYEHLLQMKKIASLGNIEARSFIRYVVDAQNMRSDLRYSLYSCKSYKELQEQYEVFDSVVDKPYKQNDGKWASNQRKQHDFNDTKSHCFNSGSVNHLLKDCKSAVKCFSCNKKWHMSRDCPGQLLECKSCLVVRERMYLFCASTSSAKYQMLFGEMCLQASCAGWLLFG